MGRKKILKLAQTAILLAIVIAMAFTPLGYLKVGPLSISFITIPVVIGAMSVGPVSGLILGTAFGVTSFIQAFLGDAFASMLLSISPVLYFLLCIPTRSLVGLLSGLLFRALKGKGAAKLWHYFLTGFCGAFFNTLFFMGMLVLGFFRTDYIQSLASGAGVIAFVVAMVGVNGLVEMITCSALGGGISRVVSRLIKKTSDGEYI